MSKYPDLQTYSALYARYLQKGVADFLQLLPDLKGKQGIDICAGSGRLTKKLIDYGASEVVMLDQESTMIDPKTAILNGVFPYTGKIENTLIDLRGWSTPFDFAVSQQAINYWLNEETAENLAKLLGSNGVFIFNTFNQKPSTHPRVLEYELDGHKFVEVSWLVGNTVHHLQVRDEYEPHHTSFQWISPDRYLEILSPYFHIEMLVTGKTSMYRCVKR